MKPIHVLIIYDTPGWAWWNKIAQIEKNIPPGVRVHKAAIGSYFEPGDYDFVVTFSPEIIRFLKFVPPAKIILGCTSPLKLERLLKLIDGRLCIGGFVNSREMYDNAHTKEHLYCCQNGVDTRLFFPAKEPVTELTACWAGNSESVHNKGLDIIKEACGLANVRLNYLDRRPLNKSANLLSLEQVREQIYHRSSFYICASEVDATPNSGLEALACGLPVISTRVGNMLELIRDGYNGFLVDRDAQSIAAAIEALKTSGLDEMGKNARASIIKEWPWKEQVKKFHHMFLDLAAKQQKISEPSMLETRPADYRDYFQWANHCRKRDDLNSAETWFRKVLAFDDLPLPLESETYFYLGTIGETASRPGWQEDLDKYIRLARGNTANSSQNIYRLASVCKRLGKTAEAEKWFGRVLTGASDANLQGGACFHLGELQLKTHNVEGARQYFERCLLLIPDHKKATACLEKI